MYVRALETQRKHFSTSLFFRPKTFKSLFFSTESLPKDVNESLNNLPTCLEIVFKLNSDLIQKKRSYLVPNF